MPLDRVPRQPFHALVDQSDGRRGRSCKFSRNKGWLGLSVLLVLACFIPSSWAGGKDAVTTFKLTLRGLEAVGGFPPPPAWVPYYPPWWGWGGGPSGPYPPPQYFAQPYSPPASPAGSGYPPQIKPAGRLVILTTPIDAEVYVDGVRLQQQPNLSYDVGLLAGGHQVDIRKEGFKPFSYKADIPPGGGLLLPVELEKQ